MNNNLDTLLISSIEGQKLVVELLDVLKNRGERLCTAESCTGGLIASEIVRVPGSSEAFDGGVVSYSNEVKHNILGVSEEALNNFGAVSSEVVGQMAMGALRKFNCDYAVATSGIAGPGGGTAEKPVGLVWFGIATKQGLKTFYNIFQGNRTEIREKSVFYVLNKLFEIIVQNTTCTFVQ